MDIMFPSLCLEIRCGSVLREKSPAITKPQDNPECSQGQKEIYSDNGTYAESRNVTVSIFRFLFSWRSHKHQIKGKNNGCDSH